MRIRKVTAHAFGPLSGETLDFVDGMTIIAGDNESAKSSWHAAIYAALCGRRRGRGAPRREEQSFIDLHKPWDGGDWLVSGEIVLDGGRRIELRQDLAGKVDCYAKDLDVGTDVSSEVMNDGSPDGARWLGLDRFSFMATACVEQAQMLRVLASADGLQSHLQRAADTAGGDSTAATALSLIDEFERERVGREWVSSTKPLRRAIDAVQDDRDRLEAARQAHDEYLRLAEQADSFRGEAESAQAQVRAHEAAAARHQADELERKVSRVRELRAALGDTPPAPAAEDDALARRAAQAVVRWQARPPEPTLTGPAAAQLQAEIDALPPMPEGDTEVHGSVAEAQAALERAEARLAQLGADRPPVPHTPAVAASASDQELLDLSHALETPVPSIDPALEVAAEAAHRDIDAARNRGKVAAGLLGAAGVAAVVAVALLVSRSAGAGAGVLLLAVALAAIGIARRHGASAATAQQGHAEAQAKIGAIRQQAADAMHRRDAAAQLCRQLGLDSHPGVIRQAVADRARAAGHRTDLAGWRERVARLQNEVRTAAAELLRSLSARGHLAASLAPSDLTVAVTEYRQACEHRAGQARQGSRRADLAAQLEARQQQERRADTDRQERQAAAAVVADAAAACRLPAGPTETAAAGLEKWLEQRSEATAGADKARQQAADLEALLNGRSPNELTQEAGNARHRAAQLAVCADPALLAAADSAAAPDRLAALHQEATGASVRAADAAGGLRRYAASVPSVAEAEEALAAAEAQLGRVRRLQETLSLTRQFLARAQDRVHRDIAPVLATTLRKWLPEITDGRYTDVIVDPATLQVQVCSDTRRWRRAERLSYGTADQIYLLLRIALADHLTKGHDTCPLILDDVTVHADAARTKAIMALLLQISAERQVILFTQEEQVADWAREHLTNHQQAIHALPTLPAD